MAVLLPYIGVTSCSRALSLIENHPDNIVGTFWVMSKYGFDTDDIPSWWIDIVLEENQAEAMLEAFERGYFDGEHDNPLYLGFCIVVVANQTNPANLSYVVQHLRMCEAEGISILELLAKYNIPAITEVTYHKAFLSYRFGYMGHDEVPEKLLKLKHWSCQLWEDYCSYLVSAHGYKMLSVFWAR